MYPFSLRVVRLPYKQFLYLCIVVLYAVDSANVPNSGENVDLMQTTLGGRSSAEDGKQPMALLLHHHRGDEGTGKGKGKRRGSPTSIYSENDMLKNTVLKEVDVWQNYHNTDDILDRLNMFGEQSSCAIPFSTQWVADQYEPGKGLFVVRLGAANTFKRVLVAAGEHARERITSEVILRFVEQACAAPKNSNLAKVFAEVGVTLLPVVNLEGRRAVDAGDVCLRSTVESEGSIDLNRNMDVDFIAQNEHGPYPFSTYQARVMKHLAESEKPLAYIDIHSGTTAMTSPWGARHGEPPDYPAQKRMLAELKRNFYPPLFNSAALKVGRWGSVMTYGMQGAVMDHMYAKQGIKHSMLWEVWGDDDTPEKDCDVVFNPPAHTLFDVVDHWGKALQHAALYVYENVTVDARTIPRGLETTPILVDESERQAHDHV